MSTAQPPVLSQPGIRLPEPIRPLPVPPGIGAALGQGSTPVRVTFTAGNQSKQVRTGPVLVTGVTLIGGAATSVVYCIDTNNEETAADLRKFPAAAQAGLFDGWLAPDLECAPRMIKGLAIFSVQADAEVFVLIKE